MLSANESVLASRAVCLSVKRGFVKSVGVGLKQLCFRPVFPLLTLYKAYRQRAVTVDSVKNFNDNKQSLRVRYRPKLANFGAN